MSQNFSKTQNKKFSVQKCPITNDCPFIKNKQNPLKIQLEENLDDDEDNKGKVQINQQQNENIKKYQSQEKIKELKGKPNILSEDINIKKENETGQKSSSESLEKEDTQTVKSSVKKNSDFMKNDSVMKYLRGMYPGVHVGHKNCIEPHIMVPNKMGWLWNLEDDCSGLKKRQGWRPGAIPKIIYRRNKKQSSSIYVMTRSGKKKIRSKHGLKGTSMSSYSGDFQEEVQEEQAPTLCVRQTKGQYLIEMNPLIIDEEENVDVRKPFEISVVPKRSENSLSKSTESSIEVQLFCPGSVPEKVIQTTTTDKNSLAHNPPTKPDLLVGKKKTV
uniref:DUF4776 domain-containing protein n=1 Tax=Clastoptera arizonana TaxID=38151 RepID=A0A1B6C8B4_9HEMI